MPTIERVLTIAAPPDRVWSLASDLEREPEFWKGSKAVRTLGVQGPYVEREVTLAFQGRLQRERVLLEPPRRIRHELVEGPMRGSKTVELVPTEGGTEVRVVWDIRLRGLLKLGARMVSRHVGEGTQNALERIRDAAEGRPPSV